VDQGSAAMWFHFGLIHNWNTVDRWCYKLNSTPGAYDFVEKKLELYSKSNLSIRECVIDSTLEKDRMFVLQMQKDASHHGMVHQGFCITEYHFENETKDWVQGKFYECPTFGELAMEEHTAIHLYACDGFLMLIVYNGGRSLYIWLFDLSTSEWNNIPENPNSKGLPTPGSMLCKAFWNVVP